MASLAPKTDEFRPAYSRKYLPAWTNPESGIRACESWRERARARLEGIAGAGLPCQTLCVAVLKNLYLASSGLECDGLGGRSSTFDHGCIHRVPDLWNQSVDRLAGTCLIHALLRLCCQVRLLLTAILLVVVILVVSYPSFVPVELSNSRGELGRSFVVCPWIEPSVGPGPAQASGPARFPLHQTSTHFSPIAASTSYRNITIAITISTNSNHNNNYYY
ncbi:hypothetical protein TCAL_00565 [Tigriopus californicus]|uniref:Uncharacterized protein n=1 Tax=Tigriopus californicus TaxID=6832 RepID=A0A553PCJ9_TIGCA|nr:hypothetical protein TCAL_00565 [Tigriopus californicus]|eukprot:TCALIF_00565-PA protein Name:"Protein of unknown function" AED:0.54 eAED:1.00 QI:0/0/0/1/1/1/2/0/218